MDLGVIGPEAQAEETQREWHGKDPQGWRHQLKTEPGAALRYERRYLFLPGGPAPRRRAGEPAPGTGSGHAGGRSDGWGTQLIPHFGGSAGNIATLLHGGGTVRFGYNVPNEFAAGNGPREYRYGAYLMAGVDGRLVFHNIFLDGNTWRSSHRVTKRPLVADLKAGFAFVLKRVELSFTQVYRTREFDDQDSADTFGSATLSLKF